ncbi:MAG: hypothetical protein ACLQBK_08725 [Candidatus Sulfotelmatobacter sp.]
MAPFIRKNPFATDPKMEMIKFVSDQATSVGSPLSDSERELLAAENPVVNEPTEKRLRTLVASIIATQKATGRDGDPRSFVNAVEWATDGEWPYVAALAEAEITGSQTVEQVERRSFSGAWLIAGCLTIFFLIVLLVLLAHRAL